MWLLLYPSVVIAAIYVRKSTEQSGVSDDQRSVARQIDHARQYAARKGWAVDAAHVYVDDGISGAEFTNRPGFVRLMTALKPRPAFQALVMSEESRLGREAIETAYALKQLVQAGVRVFFYLEDRERTLDSPTDKVLLSLTAFADELEREKARQRTYDAMQRKARAGHVTGGGCFGYRNVEVRGADGERSHVAREIDAVQAEVIREIFRLCAAGHGVKGIAKRLNAHGAPSPRAQRGRSSTWAPASVREVLFRSVYRGEIVWNQTRKRDRWGRQRQANRPASEWIRIPAPELRIVSDEAWQAAHDRLAAARAIYLRGTRGRPFGRPIDGTASPYLLTGLALCGHCGGPLRVRTRSHGAQRAKFYGCAAYHDRGRTVCTNRAEVPMADADGSVLEAVLDDLLTPEMLTEAMAEAVELIAQDDSGARAESLTREIARTDRERQRLVDAIAAGGELSGLLQALHARERQAEALRTERAALNAQRAQTVDVEELRDELWRVIAEWRATLAAAPEEARPLLSQLLTGRVTFTPLPSRRWRMTGSGTLAGLFARELSPIFPVGMASPSRSNTSGMRDLLRVFRAA